MSFKRACCIALAILPTALAFSPSPFANSRSLKRSHRQCTKAAFAKVDESREAISLAEEIAAALAEADSLEDDEGELRVWTPQSDSTAKSTAGDSDDGSGFSMADLTDDESVAAIRQKLMQHAPGMDNSDPSEDMVLEVDPEEMRALEEKLRNIIKTDIQDSRAERTRRMNELVEAQLLKGEDELRALAQELLLPDDSAAAAAAAAAVDGRSSRTAAAAAAAAAEEPPEDMFKEYTVVADAINSRISTEQSNLEAEVETMKSLQEAMERDPVLQLKSFRDKGIIKQSAFVASILIANQAAYQLVLAAQQRGGNLATAALEALLVLAGLYCYGFRV